MVNVDDYTVEKVQLVDNCRLATIFARQKELMDKYHSIEARSGLMQTDDCPVDLNDSRGQARLKDFAWRITEELGEALEAANEETPTHCHEEIADALHFLTEFTILSGLPISQFPRALGLGLKADRLKYLFDQAPPSNATKYLIREANKRELLLATGRVVEFLARTCNCLKNKPWKQSQMLTDQLRFYGELQETWKHFATLCKCAHITEDHLFNLYFRKSEVNKFRQRSKY